MNCGISKNGTFDHQNSILKTAFNTNYTSKPVKITSETTFGHPKVLFGRHGPILKFSGLIILTIALRLVSLGTPSRPLPLYGLDNTKI